MQVVAGQNGAIARNTFGAAPCRVGSGRSRDAIRPVAVFYRVSQHKRPLRRTGDQTAR